MLELSSNNFLTCETSMTQDHLTAAKESWAKYSPEEQMANIGSEVSRAIKARGNQERYWGAVTRPLDLFYLTVEDPRWTGAFTRNSSGSGAFCCRSPGQRSIQNIAGRPRSVFRLFCPLGATRVSVAEVIKTVGICFFRFICYLQFLLALCIIPAQCIE